MPLDMSPRVEVRNKNASGFTGSLLTGDAFGYAHVKGGPQAGKT